MIIHFRKRGGWHPEDNQAPPDWPKGRTLAVTRWWQFKNSGCNLLCVVCLFTWTNKFSLKITTSAPASVAFYIDLWLKLTPLRSHTWLGDGHGMLDSIKALHLQESGDKKSQRSDFWSPTYPSFCSPGCLSHPSLSALIFLVAQHFRVNSDSTLLSVLCWFYFGFPVSVLPNDDFEVTLVFSAIPSLGLCLPSDAPVGSLPSFSLSDSIHWEGAGGH